MQPVPGLINREGHDFGECLAHELPVEGLGFESSAFAARAEVVRAIAREQDTHMHLVGLALEMLKESIHSVPLLGPIALPVLVALEDPLAMLGGEVTPGNVGGDTLSLGVHEQFALAVLVRLGLPWLDGPLLE